MIGPNGAGKTTLIAQLAGELRPSAGRILLRRPRHHTSLPRAARVGLGLARSFQITSLLRELHRRRERPGRAPAALRPQLPLLARRGARPDAQPARRRRCSPRSVSAARGDAAAGELAHGEQRQLELAMALAAGPGCCCSTSRWRASGTTKPAAWSSSCCGSSGERAMLLVEHDMDAVFRDRRPDHRAGRRPGAGDAARRRRSATIRRCARPIWARARRLMAPLLEVSDLHAGYGASPVLFGVSLAIAAGRGAGAARPQRHGQDHDGARDHGPAAPDAAAPSLSTGGRRSRAVRAIRSPAPASAWCPEGRQIFPNLTVEENLVATASGRGRAPPGPSPRVYELFPQLARAPAPSGQPALGRRAADAGDRPGADDQPRASDPRRGDRGAGADDPRRDLALPGAAQGRRAGDPADRQEPRRAARSSPTATRSSRRAASSGRAIPPPSRPPPRSSTPTSACDSSGD